MASAGDLSRAGSGKETSKVFYKTIMCRYHMNKGCSRGDACQFAHSPEDLRVAPDLTRTKMCAAIIQKGRCEVPSCRFAHSRSQLRYLGMPNSEGDDGSIPQLEHTRGMKHWDQLPKVNLPQVPPHPGTKAHQMVSVPGTFPPETICAACREMSVVASGDDTFRKQPSEWMFSSQEEYSDVQGPSVPAQSSPHLSADTFMALNGGQCAAPLLFGSCMSPLAGEGLPLIPALDHASGDEKLRIQEEPTLAAMRQWQFVNACGKVSHGPTLASCQDQDACEGSIQNILFARLSV
mmetsp:Transcript_18099/g.51341  ORF Transcript_18099/g.51341 Transcript_18099/m.51341 type:complete len:292 (+) Transcript_18099:72-947(+)